MMAVNAGRSWNATEIGSRKNTVAPPDTRHNVTITSTSTAVDAQSVHRGSGPRSTATNHSTAAAAYSPRITAYSPGSQWSTSQIQTRAPMRQINGRRRMAETRTGSTAK
jgi:hypothetical protein